LPKRFETADEFYKKALENNSGSYFREKALINLAYSLKQQEKLEEMCTIWKELAQAENLTACIELAKFYEHKEKNYISALEWTENAIRISENPSANASSLLAELENRRVRLVIKLGNAD